ncbi:serine/threonine protein kinase [Actinomadura pelletieri DSM 43383]|uniref:Serine/threonine protein kinase n=2 Tax=Actinomadura pelletieri TaxID=111805 RepID=A0A495QJ74_9ACTN|nr:serine/threonine protein kinase [Actinomadura pelletieri DSM 43383]
MPDALPLRSGDPTRLGGYEILGRLGEGGQGAVFLGRPAGEAGSPPVADPAVDYVAIKLLHGGLAGEETARARFVRELEVAKRVARFCTAQVLDADVAGDQPYIVSEYVRGLSLHHVVRTDGPRTGGALERLAISTLTALTAIHQAGIVHRDFKPHNVVMGPDGPRVIDFGVARALDAAGETQNVGTPAYMAPEHFTGGQVGPASDMFAWGSTMTFAATGRPAFGNDEMASVMHRILTGEPDLGDLSGPMRDLVAACLAKEPAHRPTAREAQERLVGAASGVSASAPPVQPLPAFPGASHAADSVLPADRTTNPTGPGHGTAPQPAPFVEQPPPQGPGGYGGHPQGSAGVPSPVAGSGGGRRGRLIPVAAAAAVAAVIAGGAVWAATSAGAGDDKDQRAASGDDQGARGGLGTVASPGGEARNPANTQSGRPNGDRSPSPADPNSSKKPGTPPDGGATPSRGGGGGGTPPKEPANKYSPQQVCNSGGHGSGYYVQRSLGVPGGTAYLLYNKSTYNCAVTMKTRKVGTKSPVSVWIQKKGGSRIADSGSFAWYAGPVYVKAPGTCVRFGGNGGTAPYGNCG